jgi:hypothetical protein
MKVMLDTDTCIAIIKRKLPQPLKRFNACKSESSLGQG